MKLLKFRAENFKNIKVFDCDFQGKTNVVLSGANGAGKSAVLDAIAYHFDKAFRKSLKDPIRRGEDKGVMLVETDTFISKLTMTRKGDKFLITTKDGTAEFKSPTDLLEAVHSAFSFDVVSFLEMVRSDPKACRDLLLKLAGLEAMVAEADASRSLIFAERTTQNKEVVRLESVLNSLPSYHDDAPVSDVSVEEILSVQEDLERAQRKYAQHFAQIEQAQQQYERSLSKLDDIDREILALEQRREAQQTTATQWAGQVETLTGQTPQAVTNDQIMAVKQRLIARDEDNRKIRHNVELAETMALLEQARRESDRMTQQIQSLDHEKATALSTATFPLPGLSVDEAEVLYEGKSLAQVSDGEAIRIGVALNMAMNPALQIILIRRAALLDEAGHRVVRELAEQHDYLVIWEENDESGTMGIYLVDGEVAAIDGTPITHGLERVTA